MAAGNESLRVGRRGSCIAGLALLASVVAAGQVPDVSRKDWLTSLRPIVSAGLCKQNDSPFARAYKGTPAECVETVRVLFDTCVADDPHVRIPERIVGTDQANVYGQIVAECIGAHYQGGAALTSFHELQDRNRPGAGLVRFRCTGKESVFASDGSNPVHSDTQFGIEIDEPRQTLRVADSIANDGAGQLEKSGSLYTAYLPIDVTRKGLHFTLRVVDVDASSGRASISLRRARVLQVGDLASFRGACTLTP